MIVGLHMTLFIGPTVPLPAPLRISQAIESVKVTQSVAAPSGFQITFRVGRGGVLDFLDYPLVHDPMLRPFARVIIMVTVNAIPHVLMDGFITHYQLNPSNTPGQSTYTVTGEDISVMMDLRQKSVEHPALGDAEIVEKILLDYMRFGLIPEVAPTPASDIAAPTERVPVQTVSDLKYIQYLALKHAYDFYIVAGPVPFTNRAYWGPPRHLQFPQRALSVNMGPGTNVNSLDFEYNALAPTMVTGEFEGGLEGETLPIYAVFSHRSPMAAKPADVIQLPHIRETLYEGTATNVAQAYAQAQAIVEASNQKAVIARGALDAVRYGDVLQARGVVGVRGAGWSYDGNYFVDTVTHEISRGTYRQNFVLTRGGTGALMPVVWP